MVIIRQQVYVLFIAALILIISSNPGFGEPSSALPLNSQELIIKAGWEKLLNELTAKAFDILEDKVEFLPFGGTLTAGQSIAILTAEKDILAPEEAIRNVSQNLRKKIEQGGIKATGIVSLVQSQGENGEKSIEAVRINLEHEAGFALQVLIAYGWKESGEFWTGAPVELKIDPTIFKFGTNQTVKK
ncbi:MAG: hypothetical protein A3D92_16365 [Bacteroidetes bacterium RIFCSPHIGHO2_02_FULL_44_7]|nr:MAG: hypothetical protein A3D92_16365 [Bacteroidetes bacterium RIFCSPHIGHO2_02_FULL_44_7]